MGRRLSRHKFYKHHACLFAIVRKQPRIYKVDRHLWWFLCRYFFIDRDLKNFLSSLKAFIFYRAYETQVYRLYYEESIELVRQITDNAIS